MVMSSKEFKFRLGCEVFFFKEIKLTFALNDKREENIVSAGTFWKGAVPVS